MGPPLRLYPKAAQSIGMAFMNWPPTRPITALSNDKGRQVRIDWRVKDQRAGFLRDRLEGEG